MALMRPDKSKIDNRFLLYYYLSPQFQEIIKRRTVPGSTVDRISLLEFPRFPISIPPLRVQKRIAEILGTLDEKIELNRRTSATLEQMAQALFKSWFVDFDPVHAKAAGKRSKNLAPEIARLFPKEFEDSPLGMIPKRWKVGVLDDLIEFKIGGDWGKESFSEETPCPVLCIRGADIPNLQAGGVGCAPLRFVKKSSLEKRNLIDGDLVIEISGGSPTQSTGRPVFVNSILLEQLEYSISCSNFCRIVRFSNRDYAEYVYLLMRFLYDQDCFLQYENGTTGIKNFAFSEFCGKHHVPIPPLVIMAFFTKLIQSFLCDMQTRAFESRTLSAVRDALLPQLMSGKINMESLFV